MDQIIAGLTNLGLSGLVLAALIAFAWFRETKTLPKMFETFESQAEKNREYASRQAQLERDCCERRHVEMLASVKEFRDETMAGVKETRHAVKQLTTEHALLSKLIWQQLEEEGKQPGKTA